MSGQAVMEKPQEITEHRGNFEIRAKILSLEEAMRKLPGVLIGDNEKCPLKHTFVDGIYIREMFAPKGYLIITKIHKKIHPYFVLKGDCSVLTETGVVRIKAPFSGITPAGTKRVVYVHEDTIWITVHTNPDNNEDLSKIEERIIAKTFDELPENIVEVMGEILKLGEIK